MSLICMSGMLEHTTAIVPHASGTCVARPVTGTRAGRRNGPRRGLRDGRADCTLPHGYRQARLRRGFVAIDDRDLSRPLPDASWLVADMRELKLGRRFASHARPVAPLMFTSGPEEGEVIGSYCGEPLYHASLDPVEYDKLLNK